MANSIDEKLQYLSDTKEMIRQAISSKGQLMPTDLPFREYVDKINDISAGTETSDATATADDIINPKTAYVAGGKITGAMMCNLTPAEGSIVTGEYSFTSNIDYKSSVVFTPDKEYALCMAGAKIYGYKRNTSGNYILKTTFTDIYSGGGQYYDMYSGNISLAKHSINGQPNTYYGMYFYTRDNIVSFKVTFGDDITIQNLKAYNDAYTEPLYSMDFANNAFDIVAIAADRGFSELSIKILRITDTGVQVISTDNFGRDTTSPTLVRFSPDDKYLYCNKVANENLLSQPDIYLYKLASNYTMTRMNVDNNIKYISLDFKCAINTSNELYEIIFTGLDVLLSEKLYDAIENSYIPVNKKLCTSISNNKYELNSVTFINISDPVNITRTQVTVYRGLFDVLRTFSVFKTDSSTFMTINFDTTTSRLDSITRQGVTLYNTDNTNITSEDVVQGKTAYGLNGKIVGTLELGLTQDEYDECFELTQQILGTEAVDKDYTEFEYIGFTGYQYVSTNYTPNENTKIEITLSNVGGNDVALLSASKDWNENRYLLYKMTAGIYWAGTNNTLITSDFDNRHTITIENSKILVDDSTASAATNTITGGYYNLVIGGLGDNSHNGTMRLYNIKIYENSVLLHNLIPVADSEGRIGLFDKINEVYYYNSGSAEFEKGVIE